MWFAEQLDSFINLGICKEYPNMARSKSISGTKTNRTNTNPNSTTNTNKEQIGTGNPAQLPDVKAAPAGTTPAELAAPVKIASEPRKLEVVKTDRKVVPINLLPINLEDEIRRRAYELYLQRGPASGSEAED